MLNITDIATSVQVPQLIIDNFIKKGKPVLDNRNRPIHYSGGFAVVFPFQVDNQKWAFRCWSADLGDVEARLRKISSLIKTIHLPYFCDFTYEPEGLIVNGKKYPTTRMRWIEGLNLKDYICKECHNSKAMVKLASDFKTMCEKLHENHIAHGDLQHGNILIDDKGELFLIDYDSMFIPDFDEEKDIISGLADYQHPCRKKNKLANHKLDYFSELVIYISILAIKERPSLVSDYQIENAENLLFSKEDYKDIMKSKIYSDLKSLSPEIQRLLDVLISYLNCDNINEFGPFPYYEILNKYNIKYGAKQYCVNCGTNYKCTEDNRYCINCGKSLIYES